MFDLILSAGQKILQGGSLTKNEAMQLAQATGADVYVLAGMASKIREQYTGNKVDICSIINGKSGNCTEDCRFCAQSSFHDCAIETYPLLDEETMVKRARAMEQSGAHRFSLVISGPGVTEDDPDFPAILRIIRRLNQDTRLQLCASLGKLTKNAAGMLKEAGLSRYHHNLETSKDFFPQIVTTHTYDDRVQTLRYAKMAGLETCSGGIIGLGESREQRIDLAFALRDLQVDSVPLNILNAVPGIPLEDEPPLPPHEIIKTIALFRFILPRAGIRYAGGREKHLRDLQATGLMAGLNGIMVGNYLTTTGRSTAEDLQMIDDMGFSR